MVGYKITQQICFVCHSPIDPPVERCTKCSQFFHRSESCMLIHNRLCSKTIDPNSIFDDKKRIKNPVEPSWKLKRY
ncbi:MAG: hypothetical protein ACFFD1_16145 [Candidatus Thorarchaeota archaeon]